MAMHKNGLGYKIALLAMVILSLSALLGTWMYLSTKVHPVAAAFLALCVADCVARRIQSFLEYLLKRKALLAGQPKT